MRLVKRVQSSNMNFIQTEVNIDTVYVRFNEEKWFIDDEEGNPIQAGWIYDEEQYEIREYIEKISLEKDSLAQVLMETINTSYETQIKNEETMMEIVNMIGGLQ